MKYGLSTNGIIHKMENGYYKCIKAVGKPKLQRKKMFESYPCCGNCFRRKK